MCQRAYDRSGVFLVEDSDAPVHSGQGCSPAYQGERQRPSGQAVILAAVVVKDGVSLSY